MSRYRVGDVVRVSRRRTISHCRVPAYVQGHIGRIERVLPDFVIPEDDAWGRLWEGGRRQTLYRVQFRQVEIWHDSHGPKTDSSEIEIFENWLTRIEKVS